MARRSAHRLPDGVDLPLRRVEERPPSDDLPPLDRESWPGTLAPVRALLAGLDLDRATILVGENGAGKSTLVEAVATAWGFPVEGGDAHATRRATEGESVLAPHLQLVRGTGPARSGFFLRAETMHALAVHLRRAGSARGDALLRRSHGEGFLDMFTTARGPGLWVLDEPESALSFQGQLALLAMLHEGARAGRQVLMATHSPLLASLPGARLLEVDDTGITPVEWKDLDVVAHWRSFLEAPGRYHRHLVPE